ncbi:MAG: GntR family transcriptional regulator [Proteocatella sp.]
MNKEKVTSSYIEEMIINRIESNEYLPGEMISSERCLAEIYGVSRQTVRNAINHLVNRRYLVRIHGKGTFVKKAENNKVAFGVLNESKNASFTSLVRNFGIEISNKLLRTGVIEGTKFFSSKLNISPNEPIFGIHRIRYGNKEPLAIEYTYVPLKFFPNIANYNFERISLYDYMSSKNHLPCNFQETMTMMVAGQKLINQLKLTDENIVNHIEIFGYDRDGNLVEYTESYSRPDKLEVRFVTNR